MTTRRKARRVAIDILYQADLTGAPVERVVSDWRAAGRDVPVFAEELVDGVDVRQPEIDLLLEEHSEGWTVARMAALDRTILRLGVYAGKIRYVQAFPVRLSGTTVRLGEPPAGASGLTVLH